MAIKWDDEQPAAPAGVKWDDEHPAQPVPQDHAQGVLDKMPWYDKALAGAGHDMLKVLKVTGASKLLPKRYQDLLVDEDAQRNSKALMDTTAGMLGGFAGETALLAPIGAGVGLAVKGAAGASRVARALPRASRLLTSTPALAAAEGAAETAASGGDVTTGAAVSGAIPVVAGAAGKVLPKVLRKAGEAMGYRHLRARGGDISARVPLSGDAILEAYKSGAFRPGTTVHYAAEKLAAARKMVGKEVGDIEAELTRAGVTGPEREALAQVFETEAGSLKRHTSARDPRMAAMADEAADLRSEIPALAPGTHGPQPPSPLSLSEALDKKRSAQWMADKEYDKLSGQLTAAGEGKKRVAGTYKTATEHEIATQGGQLAPDAAARWRPANERFSHIAGAEQVAEEGAARARGRNWLSPLLMGAAGGSVLLGGGDPAQALGAAAAIQMLRTRGGSTGTYAAFKGADKLDDLVSLLRRSPVGSATGIATGVAETFGGNQ